MDLTEGSETSKKLNLTPGKYRKENIQDLPTAIYRSNLIMAYLNFVNFRNIDYQWYKEGGSYFLRQMVFEKANSTRDPKMKSVHTMNQISVDLM
jgi:hypothetical protein